MIVKEVHSLAIDSTVCAGRILSAQGNQPPVFLSMFLSIVTVCCHHLVLEGPMLLDRIACQDDCAHPFPHSRRYPQPVHTSDWHSSPSQRFGVSVIWVEVAVVEI